MVNGVSVMRGTSIAQGAPIVHGGYGAASHMLHPCICSDCQVPPPPPPQRPPDLRAPSPPPLSFVYSSCNFKVQKSKGGTGRVVGFKELGLVNRCAAWGVVRGGCIPYLVTLDSPLPPPPPPPPPVTQLHSRGLVLRRQHRSMGWAALQCLAPGAGEGGGYRMEPGALLCLKPYA